ncbi:MAG: dihydroorotate dehydrogenase [Christensenellales bacterium]|jgi:dihydroorotate dehydrogenase (NAD+) catalytic subunit
MSVDLSVSICGVNFKNPVIAASGTFGFGFEYGAFFDVSLLGGISSKGLTPQRREGNPSPRIAEAPAGMLNAVGLQNPGIDDFVKNILPEMKKLGTVIIANVAGSSVEDYALMTEKLQDTAVDMVELNISCPNVKEGGVAFGVDPRMVEQVTKVAKKHCAQPLIVKLTPNVSSIPDNARAAEAGGADAISLINTLTGMAIDPVARRRIIANKTGGLSGPAIKPVALRMVYEASKAVGLPIIGMGGIMTGRDVAEFMLAGASAVMVGSATVFDPLALPRIIDELRDFCEQNQIAAVRELTGALVD